jgi:ATP-dependent Lon protease
MLTIIPVAHADDVIARALSRKPEAIEWHEPAEPVAATPPPVASLPH